MANQQDKDAFAKELLRQFNRETKGMTPEEKEEYKRNMFVKAKPRKAATKMTAAKGGMAKPKRMRGGGMAKMAKKKMMRGGAVKKK